MQQYESGARHCTQTECQLCSTSLPVHPIVDGEKVFCCMGCHAVFQILSAKNALEGYQDHPIFKQALRSGLISNPQLLEQIRSKRHALPETEIEKFHLEIQDMWCPSCAEAITLILLKENGVHSCIIDYATDLAAIEYYPRYISKDKIDALIKSLGYRPSPLDNPEKKAVTFSLYARFIIAAFFALNIMMFSYPIYASYFDEESIGYAHLFSWLSLAASIPILLYSAWPILRRFILSMRTGILGMETLVVMGVGSAFAFSLYEMAIGTQKVYFDSMSVIIVFVLLGKIMEAKAKFSAKDTLLRLHRSLPRRGRKRFPDGSQQFVSIKDIAQHDILLSFAGEKIVTDGTVVEGTGSCDESLITGESIPVVKETDSKVLGGSLVQQGWIAYRVSTPPEESTLHHIINTVEKEMGYKSAYIRSADRIVRWFVPLVITLAFLTAAGCIILGIVDDGRTLYETSVMRAVAVLLISCPCAIGIAAPLAESHLIQTLACSGAIIRNRGCLSLLGKETTIIFDKTGTVTEGQFTVQKGLEGLTAEQKQAIKGLASHSIHPISCAIVHAIPEDPISVSQMEECIGKGIRGYANGKCYHIGSASFLQQIGINIPSTTSQDEGIISKVYVSENNRKIATLLLGDRIRPHVANMLKELPIKKKILLSGDSQYTVEIVAKTCGFDEWLGGCHPLQKKAFIDDLRKQGQIICMVGDGVNDAPALIAANIGVSVLNATDISIQVSDILLTTHRLDILPTLYRIANRGQKIINQNLFWTFFYNILGIPLAMLGILSPIFAAFAMVASSLMVLGNSKRLNF